MSGSVVSSIRRLAQFEPVRRFRNILVEDFDETAREAHSKPVAAGNSLRQGDESRTDDAVVPTQYDEVIGCATTRTYRVAVECTANRRESCKYLH